MASYTCPACDHSAEPKAQIGAVLICGHCGASLVLERDTVRPADYADLRDLTPTQLDTLRKARGRTR